MDLVVGDERGVRLLANDGGNSSLSMQVAARRDCAPGAARTTTSASARGSSFAPAISIRRASSRSRVTHFGLGPHLKADVLRIEWPNGVPQTVYFPGTDQDVLENRDAQRLVRVRLYLGRQALPLRDRRDVAQRVGHAARAHGAARRRPRTRRPARRRSTCAFPASALQPRDGKYVLQLTEELWETAYADQLKLLAVDHPDSVDVFVDERFVPPGPVKLRLFQVVAAAARRCPRSTTAATTSSPALREHDDRLRLEPHAAAYQGLVEPHDLILDLGPDAGATRIAAVPARLDLSDRREHQRRAVAAVAR